MSYHEDLLEQAAHLATREARKPKQASLRRAVSAAYYSLFHLLSQECARMFVSDDQLGALVQRALNHVDMKDACNSVTQKNLPDAMKPFGPVSADLVNVAEAFVTLQKQRNRADYDLASSFSRTETLDLIAQAEGAIKTWLTVVRTTPFAKVFLASIVFGKKWNR